MPTQDAKVAKTNATYFDDNREYAANVARLATYRNIRRAINGELVGMGRLLDVGNGGVFDYNTDLAREVVGVDLFLDADAARSPAANVVLRRGDALALSEDDAAYDGVLQAFVFHHLTGSRPDDVVPNIRRALSEAHRVLVPGGRLIVAESCVPAWMYAFERVLFRPLALVAGTRLMSHPPTIQLPADEVERLIGERFVVDRVSEVPMGRWVMQFGKRWPSRMTPARPYVFVATRD